MNAKRSGSFGGSLSVWLTDYRIVGLLNQKVRNIIDTTSLLSPPSVTFYLRQSAFFILHPTKRKFLSISIQWVLIGRRNDPDIHFDVFRSADSFKSAGFQHAQQLGLDGQ